MTGLDTLKPTPLSKKLSLVTHHHLLTRVSVKLDLDNWNYGSWEYFFEQLCESYDVDKYLHSDTTDTSSSSLAPLTPEELKVDKIVLSWILFTLSDSLCARLVVMRPKSAREAWGLISEIVKDNKRSRANALKADLEARVNEEDVIHYALVGLPETYNQVCGYMHWKDVFPDLKMVRSLLIAEEMRLKSKALTLPVDSSSPMVLVAESSNNRRPTSTPQGKSWKPCFNFAKGTCRFGDSCRYVHDANARVGTSNSTFNKGRGTNTNNTNEILNKLLNQLGNLGLHPIVANTTTHTPPPVAFVASPLPTAPAQHMANVPSAQQLYGSSVLGQAQQVQSNANGSTVTSGQATVLPHAFTTGTLHDPSTGAWNMDTGASSHLNNYVLSLSDVFNSCMYSSVSVGDGHSIPVANTGHSILQTPSKTLRLNNVLITPHIIKNLIYVRQFVRDNDCTIEFDSFGFSVKDFMTRRVLLRCDSTGDLYPVTAPSPIPHAFLANLPPTFWVETLNMVTHLLNILPSTAIANDVPFTRLFGTSPDYSLLRTFGCLCYPHLYPTTKFEPCATPSIFLGHASNHRGYRCLDLSTKKILISRHVTFDETIFPYGSAKPVSVPSYDFLDDPEIPLHHVSVFSPSTTTLLASPGPNSPSPTAQPNITLHGPNTTPPTVHSPHHTTSPTGPTQSSTRDASPLLPLKNNSMPSQIIPDPPTNPNPSSVHSMVIRFRVGSNRPPERLSLYVSSVSLLPKSYRDAFHDSNWQTAMCDEYNALIKNNTWTLVPRPPDANVVRYRVDVDETFSPVVKPGTIRTILSLAASRHWPIHQLDVKNAFLHGDLSETVYMYQPPGFRDSTHPDYGLDTTCLLLYVDDLVLTTSSQPLLQRIIQSLHQEFAMTDLGSLNYFLGISVTRDSSGIFLSQKKYVVEILERAGMINCNPIRTPVDTESKLGDMGDVVLDLTLYRSLAGSLQYLTFTRPDISYAVQQLFSSSTTDLVAYSDADWAGCPTTRSAEAEYRGVVNAVAETCWLRNLLRELHTPLTPATLVYCDNVSVVYLSCNPVQHQCTKHIEIDIHFVHDLVDSEDSVQGNGKKAAGFWREVAERFHEEMGEDKRSYDSVSCKWKNRIRPKILKDHPKWKKVEMPKFYKSKQSSSKKSRTSENTSQGNSDSAHIGVNLNDEAADSEDVEAQEVPAPIGRDRAKKKGSSSGARSETSIAGDPSLVDALLSKFTMAATPFFTQRKESSSEYLRIKERELELEERKRQEQGELERLRIAQRDKELDLQQKMFEFQQQQKFEEDLKYYNEDHDHLTGRALSTALFLKKKIKERWNLDY
ncbi:ribonuclease H-like domain-containing protein [Tanacetum coccineum]